MKAETRLPCEKEPGSGLELTPIFSCKHAYWVNRLLKILTHFAFLFLKSRGPVPTLAGTGPRFS
jgi:hypothetical protein